MPLSQSKYSGAVYCAVPRSSASCWLKRISFLAGQFIDTDQLGSEVIRAAIRMGLVNNFLCRLVQVMFIFMDETDKEIAHQVFMDAICHQQEDIALVDLQRVIVDFEILPDAQSTVQVAVLMR